MENDVGKSGEGILVKEELCKSVVKIQKGGRMMTMCLIFWEKIIRVICVYAPQSGKPATQKNKFYDELIYEWDIKGTKELTLGIGNFNGHVKKNVDGFESVHGGNDRGAIFGR